MFSNILVPLDLCHEPQQARVLEVAQSICAAGSARLHLLYVDQNLIHQAGSPQIDNTLLQRHDSEARSKLEAIKTSLEKEGLSFEVHISRGVAHDQILEVAERLGCDAIVMQAKKPGVSSYFIGSNAERVVRHAACSVVVVRD